MQIDFAVALKDPWDKPIIVREGSEDPYLLGDAVVDALNFQGKGQKERSEEDKRRRWRLVLRLTRSPVRIEDSKKYPTLETGSEPNLTPTDITLIQQALHERFDSPMIYAQAYEMLCVGTGSMD